MSYVPTVAVSKVDPWPHEVRVVRNMTNQHQEYEPKRGVCSADETDTLECVFDGIGHYGKRVTIHVMECSECGRTYEHVNGDYEYCPHCGRHIVEMRDD